MIFFFKPSASNEVLISGGSSDVCSSDLSALEINPLARMKPPLAEHIFGTDGLGRGVYARVVWGARVSLVVGVAVALVSVVLGVLIGMLAGYFSKLDMLIMRIMDGLMAMPNILLAIADRKSVV